MAPKITVFSTVFSTTCLANNKNKLRITDILFRESTSHQWIPPQRASNAGQFACHDIIINELRLPSHRWLLQPSTWYSISQEICTRSCCALLWCGYAIVHNEFTWSIYPYSSVNTWENKIWLVYIYLANMCWYILPHFSVQSILISRTVSALILFRWDFTHHERCLNSF